MDERTVAVNDRGLRIGEDHQGARLTDAEVELIREMHEAGVSYGALAEKFGIGKSTVADIVKYRRRGQTPSAWRVVRVLERG